jgi:uncharacterized lipoprotein YddW (UPF0748 family)
MKFASGSIVISLFLAASLHARVPPGRQAGAGGGTAGPQREVRAVWLTTIAGLDWPLTFDTAAQKASLVRIVERLHAARFNTIFFQVRSRGDAVYRSGVEPWSEVLTGTPGRDPGWDPLAFVIAEAHRRGMEVHAWFNTYLVKGGNGAPPRTTPPHVMTTHPEWARFFEDRWWLDPGEPGVERFIVGVVKDLLARYDVDGLQLDYLRYPGRNFDDDRTYARYGGGRPRDDWRRENITRLLERVAGAVRDVRPAVRLGVTPIGIYRNPHGVRGLESYSDVFQDTYHWIERGLVDYIVPQLYWPIGGGNGDPDFAAMAAEWREQTPGCQLYLGIGSYKDEVLEQSERLVAVARASGAEGEAFFRYSSISPQLPFAAYARPAMPPAMPWRDSVPPAPARALTVSREGRVAHLSWTPPAGDESEGWYALYRTDRGNATEGPAGLLIAVVPSTVTSWSDTGVAGDEPGYAVTRVDRGWNESAPTPAPERAIAAAGAPGPVVAAALPAPAVGILRVGTPLVPGGGGRRLFLPLILRQPALVDVSLTASAGGDSIGVFREERGAGGHVITLDLSGLRPGVYRCTVVAGGDVGEREVRVGR